jgi:hypothetical protein
MAVSELCSGWKSLATAMRTQKRKVESVSQTYIVSDDKERQEETNITLQLLLGLGKKIQMDPPMVLLFLFSCSLVL